MSILRIFKKENHADPVMLAKQADAATAIHSITVPKYRVKGNFVEYVIECSRISTTWQVYRRYQQFKTLDQQLRSLCSMGSPHHCEFGVVPFLCGSHWTEVTNQSPELVERRRCYLEIYLQQLPIPKNLFYAAKTALYNFLHDGEVPILHKSRNNRPLPGYGMLPSSRTAAATKDIVKGGRKGENVPRDDDSEGEDETKSRQVIAGQHKKPQENLISDSVPDYSAKSANRVAYQEEQTLGRAAAAAVVAPAKANNFVDPTTIDTHGFPRERCMGCGFESTVDYPVEEWTQTGRCPECRQFVTFELVGDKEPSPTVHTIAALPREEAENFLRDMPPDEGGEEKDDDAAAHDSSSESAEDADDDFGSRAVSIACQGCRRMFDIKVLPRHCKLCSQRFCKDCTKKVSPLVIAGDPHPDEPTTKPDTTNKKGAERLVRICERCALNLDRRKEGVTPLPDANMEESDSTGVLTTSTQAKPVTTLATPVSAPSTTSSSAGGRSTSPSRTRPPPPSLEGIDVALSDFQLITTLGRGTFGKVLKVKHIPSGHVFAMKVLNKSVIHKRRMIDYIKEEKNIMTYIGPHPFVCRCHYTFQTDYHLFFVLDYLPGGELYGHIYPSRNLQEADARFYIAEVILAMEHIHKHDVAHRDLKPENIVLDEDGHLKVTDFGLARMNFSRIRRRSFVGSAEYLAPETIQGDVQTKALDWWSVGVMLFELLCGVAPFHAATNNEVYQHVLNKKPDFAGHKGQFSPTAQHLITKLLEKDVRQRLADPTKIKAHPFFAGLDWEKLAQRELTPPFVPNLNDNDTKYFSRDFTSEWATIHRPHGVGRQTIELLNRRFSNFRQAQEERPGVVTTPTAQNEGSLAMSAPGGDWGNNLINPDVFVGVWRLVKVEMVTEDGKTCYPWGSEVVGLLKYTPNGLYALQMCPLKRTQFRNVGVEKITREELSDAYLTYVAAFGTYTVTPGKSYIVHAATGGLYPNSAQLKEKRYFEVLSETRIKLSTVPLSLEDGMVARTVATWEKVSL